LTRHTLTGKRGTLLLVLATVATLPALAQQRPGRDAQGPAMSIPQAALLGLVEGVTEYLPVSSTGHLTVVQGLLGLWGTPAEKDASDAYAVCIQAGAIIAVFLISFGRIKAMVRGIFGRDKEGLHLAANLVVAFLPAAAIGLLLENQAKEYLFGIWPVAAAWLAGGLFILFVLSRRKGRGGTDLGALTWKGALVIGVAQVIALWPGVSRSLVTMAAGIFLGMSVSAAVEFSFLLGLVTLGAATIYEGITLGPAIVETFGWVSPVVGILVAAASAFIAVRWMVSYLRTRSLAVFGAYRVAIALVVAALVLTGVIRS
jgi:undecaprenyl-diphosphatase